MSDLQILIENIRTAISFSETISPDQLKRYARDYSEACDDLNRRLRQCIPHIRKGNVAEAVRLAEMPPNIPDQYSLLDFPEREEWVDIVSTLGFDTPPALPAELARELNATYLKHSPLEPLFRWHRLHALNGSPIRNRLSVIRAIAKADRENTFWSEDQEKYEKIRISELEKEVRVAVSSENPSRVRSLLDELNSSDWCIRPPKHLSHQLCSLVLQHHADEMQQAFSAFDYDKAVQIRAMMENVLVNNGMTMPPQITQALQPATHWIAESGRQTQFDSEYTQACCEMREALEIETPLATLERLYYSLHHAATQAGRDIPADIDQLYQTQIESQQLKRSRTMKMVVTSIVCGSILVGSLIAWALMQRMHQQQVANILDNIKQMETEEHLDSIPGFIERIERAGPKMAKRPEIAAGFERLRTLKKEDELRAADFQRYCAQAISAMNVPPQSSLATWRQIELPIEQAEKSARSPSEKTQYNDLKLKYDALLSARKREIDAAFSESLTKIANDFKSLRRKASKTRGDALRELNDMILQTAQLCRQDDVSPALLKTGKEFADDLAKYHQAIEAEMVQEKTFQQLSANIGNWSAYGEQLKEFAKNHSGHHAATDVAETANELDKIRPVITELNELSRLYADKKGDFNEIQAAASDLFGRSKKLGDKLKDSSLTEIFPPVQLLETLSKMPPVTVNTFKNSEKLLKDLSQRELWPWVDKQDRWFYLTKKPDKAGRNNYVTTFVSEEKTTNIPPEDFANAKPRTGTQYQFAIAAQKKLDQIDKSGRNLVESCGDLLSKMLEADGIDPILKCIVLDAFFSDVSKANPFFEEKFAKAYNTVSKSNVDMFTNWMDVIAKNTMPQRNLASAALQRLPDIKKLAAETRQKQEDFVAQFAMPTSRFEWIGILVKQNGIWSCDMKSTVRPTDRGSLYILRAKADGKVQSYKIGRVSQNGECVISENLSMCIQCLPVFFKN